MLKMLRELRTRYLSRQINRDHNICYKGSTKPLMTIGEHTYINSMLVYCWDQNVEFTIGKYCSIADSVTVLAGGEHHYKWVSTYPFIDRWKLKKEGIAKPMNKGNISIGHDVWIGHGATVLSGVKIGSGAVIGAQSVVAKDVPDYAIVVGNPARVIKYRFEREVIDELLELGWWNWPEDKLLEYQVFFNNPQLLLNELNKSNSIS